MLRRLPLVLCLAAALAAGQQTSPGNTTPGCANLPDLPRTTADDTADQRHAHSQVEIVP